jgi:hypothetical protein
VGKEFRRDSPASAGELTVRLTPEAAGSTASPRLAFSVCND